jgi:hypothetical protein
MIYQIIKCFGLYGFQKLKQIRASKIPRENQ